MPTSPWTTLYARLITANGPSRLFDRLVHDDRDFVVVTGCQRSGTTWMRKLLAEALSGAAAPKEYDAACFLVDGTPLPVADASTVVLQATFANIYPEAFTALPRRCPLVLMARNPYSVCRSLVYNWDSLAVEHAHRQGRPDHPTELEDDGGRWRAAVDIYAQSMRAGIELLTRRTEGTRLVVFDELVAEPTQALVSLSGLLGRPVRTDIEQAAADPSTTAKHESLPAEFRRMVAERCLAPFEELLARAGSLGVRAGPLARTG